MNAVTDLVPEAYVDGLVIMNDAPSSVLPMSINEMHLYSYLGCILGLFKGKPVADWGYPEVAPVLRTVWRLG